MGVVSQALEKRRTRVAEQAAVKDVATQDPFGLTAAAANIPLDGTGWQTFKLGDQKWQKDGWHHYDINGDLRFLANWVGKACSRARLYLAKVDENGRPGKEVDDPKLQIIAETMFGSPASKAEAQRLMGVHLFVPGESFIVAEAADKASEDRWYVVSTSDIRRQGQTQVEVRRPQQFGGGWYALKPGTDLLIRCWTPHPRAYDQADSSVRTGLIPLREIEQLTKFEFAEIDSRLAGAGILLVPDEMEFPRPPGAKADAASLAAQLTKTMAAALASREDPASLVPIVIQVPGDLVDKVKHLTFANILSSELKDRMEGAVNRLARCLETEPEILTGKADMNHWSSWQVDESTINIHVAPLLSRMCDALTAGYVRAALQVIGEDPDGYVLWYDTAMLTVEPDRQEDGMEMWEKGLISDDAARKSGSWGEGDEPDDEEYQRRFAEKMVGLDPSKIEWPDIRKAIGRGVEKWEPPTAPAEGADQANAPAGAATADKPGGGTPNPDNVRQLPTGAQRQQPPDRQDSRQAAALRVGAHMAVQRALELAGKRLLTRANRDRFQDVPAHELHTKIRVGDPTRVDALLASGNGPAVDLSVLAEAAEVDEQELANLLGAYCSELMVRGIRHNADLLNHFLAAGLHADCTPQGCAAPEHPGRCDEEVRAFHLPGRHNQQTHGHRQHGGTGKPFTEHQNLVRRAMRNQGKDPDAHASAKDRQGKRAFREWSQEAERLNKMAKDMRETRDAGPGGDKDKAKAAKKAAAKPKTEAQERTELDQFWGKRGANIARQDRDDLGPDGAERFAGAYENLTKGAENLARLARGENPAVLSKDTTNDGTGQYSEWNRFIPQDTGLDNPITVRDMTIQGHTIKHGLAWRIDGIVVVRDNGFNNYMATASDRITRRDYAAAKRQVQSVVDMHKNNLPAGSLMHQNAYMLTPKASPGDAYWQKRFNNKSHKAVASAGGGVVAFWGVNGFKPMGQSDGAVVTHEFGHNLDVGDDGKRHGVSNGFSWKKAQKDDKFGGYGMRTLGRDGDEVDPELQPYRQTWTLSDRNNKPLVTDFQETGVIHHSVNFGYGTEDQESPWGPTTYGKSSNMEDLAESLRLYLKGPEFGRGRLAGSDKAGPVYFRDLYPGRAEILDGLLPKIAEQQLAEIKKRK